MLVPFALTLLMAAPAPRVGLAMNIPEGTGPEAFVSSLREQIRLGLDGMHMSYKWEDLEKSPGQVDLKPFTDGAGLLSFLGGEGHVLLQVVDTNQLCLPADLKGKALDSPEVMARWKSLLGKVVPSLGPSVRWLSLSNEVDGRLLANPQEKEPFLRFLEEGRRMVKSLRPDLKVSVTVMASCLSGDPALARRLWEGMDFLDVTYYAQDGTFQVKDREAVAKDLDQILSFDPTRKVVLQEFGMACDPLIGGSEDKQADFVRQGFEVLRAKGDRIDLLSFFLQYDFSSALVDQFVAYYGVAGPRFRAYLSSLGLKNAKGEPRKSWGVLKEEMARFKPF